MADEKSVPIKVVALAPGYYGNVYRVKGEKFSIASEDFFSKVWMKRVEIDGAKAEAQATAKAKREQAKAEAQAAMEAGK